MVLIKPNGKLTEHENVRLAYELFPGSSDAFEITSLKKNLLGKVQATKKQSDALIFGFTEMILSSNDNFSMD